MSIPSQIDIVRTVRAKYPRTAPGSSPLGEDAWTAIVDVAKHLGVQVFRKDGGDHTAIPAGVLAKYPGGVGISRTIVGRGVFGNQWVKVFGDGEGAAPAIWSVGDTPADGEYIDVSGVTLPGEVVAPPPVVTPPPSTPPSDLDLAARVALLEQWRVALTQALRSVA